MSFEEKPYHRKLAKKDPERFKELIRRNEERLIEGIELQLERVNGLKRILKEVQDGGSQSDERRNEYRRKGD